VKPATKKAITTKAKPGAKPASDRYTLDEYQMRVRNLTLSCLPQLPTMFIHGLCDLDPVLVGAIEHRQGRPHRNGSAGDFEIAEPAVPYDRG
jgi:hypothetical protein